MLVFAIANVYHCHMPKYIQLRNGLEVPEDTLLSNTYDIYKMFNRPLSPRTSMPDILFRLVLTLQSDMSEQWLSRSETNLLEDSPLYDFHIGHIKPQSSYPAMARSAIALNMIIVDECNGDIEGHFEEPIGPHMPILPIVYQKYTTEQKALIG